MHVIWHESDWLVHFAFSHRPVFIRSLLRKAGFILLIPIAKNNAILEMYCTIITCISSMHLSLQLWGLNYSFKCVAEPRTNPRLCEVFGFWPRGMWLGKAMAERTYNDHKYFVLLKYVKAVFTALFVL